MNVRSRPLLLLLLAVVVGAGLLGWRLWSGHAERVAAEDRLFAEVDEAVRLGDPRSAELSRLVARLQELGADGRRTALALARIELLRGRCERAAEHLQPLMTVGGELPELRTAAAAWLCWCNTVGREASERESLLRQALRYAEAAVAAGGGTADRFVAWQAAVRLGDEEAGARHASALQQADAGSIEARTVAIVDASADLSQPLEPVTALLAEWPKPPLELRLVHVVLLLQHGALDRAVALADELLAEAPNLVEVRNWAATAHHAAAKGTVPGPAHDRHVALRDEQIGWLDANASADDVRRPQWLAWRQER
jgi:hypothetical protein